MGFGDVVAAVLLGNLIFWICAIIVTFVGEAVSQVAKRWRGEK